MGLLKNIKYNFMFWKFKKQKFGTGALQDPIDTRDFRYEEVASAGEPVDWKKGYDIEKELNFTLPFKNQNGSSACVGEAWSYYIAILNLVETGIYSEASAKAIYSQISVGFGKGAFIRDGGKLSVNWGSLYEYECPSYMSKGNAERIAPDEAFMTDKDWKTPELDRIAKILQAKEYRTFDAGKNMDLFAMAIRDNHGVVGGVNGDGKSGWNTNEPTPPETRVWGHGLYWGKFGIDEIGKFVATPNSWGNVQRKKDALHPDGWQKLREDYFDSPHMFNPWTLVDKPNAQDESENVMSNVKLIKDKNSKAVGFWLPAVSEDGLRSMALNYGYKIPLKANGTVDWEKVKFDGLATLIK